MKDIRKKRSEIDGKYKWDLSKMYKDPEEWEKDVDKLKDIVKDIVAFKGKIMADSHSLLNTLKKCEELDRIQTNVYCYAYLKYHEDTANNEAIKMTGRIDKIMTELNENIVFVQTEILKSDYSLIKTYMTELEELKVYDFMLESLFRKKDHILGDEEESLLASAGEVLFSSSQVYDVITDTDLKYGEVVIDGKTIEITSNNLTTLSRHKNQNVRKKVFNKYYKVFKQYKNTLAATFKYNVKSDNFIAKARKYDNPLQMSLYQNKIDLSIYDNLIQTINNHLDVMHKYIGLRKKALKVDKLHMYDIYAPLIEKLNKEYPYESAPQVVKEALKPLGEEYLRDLNKAFEQKWIDVYDNVGKHGGAYSWGTYDSYPYILLNYNGTLNDISTLAHELGHSMHSYYTNKVQPITYAGHAIFTAEVASTVNEMLLSKYLLEHTNDKEEKRSILNELMEKFKGTLYRQTMFAEFEKTIFEKEKENEVLTAELISDIYYNLNKKYYGEDIVHDSDIRYEWARIPHFYRPFYVYQYATGISAACAIVSDILSDKKDAVSNYIKFLSSGTSNYPIELLKIAGVDMSTTEPIEKAIKMFDDTIEEFISLDN